MLVLRLQRRDRSRAHVGVVLIRGAFVCFICCFVGLAVKLIKDNARSISDSVGIFVRQHTIATD
jgi:hypothetical protein